MVLVNDIAYWVTSDSLLNLLLIASIIAGAFKAIDHKYQRELQTSIAVLEREHTDDIQVLCKNTEDKFSELLRGYNELRQNIRDLMFANHRK